jgi:hypothetical protein
MGRLYKILPALLVAAWCTSALRASTGYLPLEIYLDEGGKNVDASPEFYWELEVKRLARDFHPSEKLVLPKIPKTETPQTEEKAPDFRREDTAAADMKDFENALKEGRIKPADTAKAMQQHKTARDSIDSTSLPDEFASEFADYHRGAFAYHRGKEHWGEARQAWEDLLKRPEQDRHYRSVWAAFMLGKLALKSGDPEAVKWFQKTRELAKSGFADSLGMAADSYGWEGRSEWKQEHPSKAAELFLIQLALGDESAIVSLKALIPDRDPVEGMLNYGLEPEEKQKESEQQKHDDDQKSIAKLRTAAEDPLLRRLVSAHILATASARDIYFEESSKTAVNRCARWLGIIKETKLGQIEDAEYLGWIAYNNGDYKGAARWLQLSKGDTPAAWWLRAKLQRRDGKLAEAAKSMAQAWHLIQGSSGHTVERTDYDSAYPVVDNVGPQLIQALPGYTGWSAPADEGQPEYRSGENVWRWSFAESASGDLGGLHLARGDFVQALDVLWKGRLWNDTAFIAEDVLTTNELKKYVDALPNPAPPTKGEDYNAKLRYLLGRRLVRDKRYGEAAAYLKPPYDKILEKYVEALNQGADAKLTKVERARALFTAAWLARYDGMELMGTEVAPDAFAAEGGQFELTDLAKQRQTGFYQKVSYGQNGEQKNAKLPITLKPSKQELQRLAANKINPDMRFHYRLIAAALAIKAAELLPNDSEELADVVNHAGLWVKDRDEKLGNRYYQIIERRCPKTEIGRAAAARHWFVDQSGPWSDAQQQAHDALHKELKLDNPEQ